MGYKASLQRIPPRRLRPPAAARRLAAVGRHFALALLLLAAGCDDFVTYGMWEGQPSIAPEEAAVEVGRKLAFEAAGGRPPYRFELASGGGELAVSGARAEYTAPAATGPALIRVTDELGGRAEARITVLPPPPPLAISPKVADVWLGGSVQFRASGGEPPYVFSVKSGPGSIGAASGKFSASILPGTSVVQVTDRRGGTSLARVTVKVLPFF